MRGARLSSSATLAWSPMSSVHSSQDGAMTGDDADVSGKRCWDEGRDQWAARAQLGRPLGGAGAALERVRGGSAGGSRLAACGGLRLGLFSGFWRGWSGFGFAARDHAALGFRRQLRQSCLGPIPVAGS